MKLKAKTLLYSTFLGSIWNALLLSVSVIKKKKKKCKLAQIVYYILYLQKTQKTNRLSIFHEYWTLRSLHVFQFFHHWCLLLISSSSTTVLILVILVIYIIWILLFDYVKALWWYCTSSKNLSKKTKIWEGLYPKL